MTKKKAKRIIKPSKGGRTARAPEARMTPEDLEALKALLAAREMSFADWLHEQIEADGVSTENSDNPYMLHGEELDRAVSARVSGR